MCDDALPIPTDVQTELHLTLHQEIVSVTSVTM